MFNTALLTGLYAYSILFLGLLGQLSRIVILIDTFIFLVIILIPYRKIKKKIGFPAFRKQNLIFYLILSIFFLLVFVNLIGALGPELAFDALWYHLTLPKLYLLKEAFYFIPGGTLSYSTFPQLTEMLYLPALAIHSEILAKLVHFFFGIGTCLTIYKIARDYLSKEFSLLAVLIFYSNLAVAWESITAYIDLARTFFELLAFWGILKWIREKKDKWLIYSSLMTGFAISTKLLSFGTLAVLLILIFSYSLKLKQAFLKIFRNLILYFTLAIFVASPWFIHSFINRGNPFYPLFSLAFQGETNLPSLSPLKLINDLWQVFTHAADPISPVYMVFFPLIFIAFKKFSFKERIFFYFSLLSLIVWYLTPRTGGGRFIIPFLPVLSILVVLTLNILKNRKMLALLSIIFIVFISLTTVFFRGAANYRYLDYILGRQTKEEFLGEYLEFDFGNFADIDGYFAKKIQPDDMVLLYGVHNLYYVNFPFIDGSWVKKGDRFNYIAVKGGELPEAFKDWKQVYSNEKTFVKLYSNNGKFWTY